MNYVIISIIGYLIGSFPTAYVLLKRIRDLDITKHGSGNVGTLNAFEVSKSKSIGFFILIIDVFKGFLCIYLARLLFPVEFIYCALALLFGVIGHCYSPWIKFKGGRGLATAAGGFLILSPFILLSWLVLWAASQAVKNNIHISNVVATILTAIIVITSNKFLIKYSNPTVESSLIFVCPIIVILLVITIKHIGPLKEHYKNGNIYKKVNAHEKI